MLTLTIRNPGSGAPAPFVIDRRDVAIGRAAGVDWQLPDPQVSSRHCEIGFRDGNYLLRDTSTNGTLVNGTKLAGIHRLADRDVIGIGGLEVAVSTGATTAGMPDAWQRSSATSPRTSAQTSAPGHQAHSSIDAALVAAVGTLLATRKRQLSELGATVPDALARNPLAGDAADAPARLAAMPPPAAMAAIAEAADAIERHHAASLRAMQSALRTAVAELDPTTIAATDEVRKLPEGDARDAASWRAFRRRFDREQLAGKGFVETFARAFREAYEQSDQVFSPSV